jgi:hypothetical protein
MRTCSACSAQVLNGTRFCPQCGKPTGADPDSVETVAVGAVPASQMPSHMGTTSGLSRGDQRFAPGRLLASRYRIISRLGKGGMGEVFRADDLILGQTVALKFLPEGAKGNVNLLTRFYDEVRIAHEPEPAHTGPADWTPLFAAVGIDLATLNPPNRSGRLWQPPA